MRQPPTDYDIWCWETFGIVPPPRQQPAPVANPWQEFLLELPRLLEQLPAPPPVVAPPPVPLPPWEVQRQRILERDGRTCRYCGREASQIDHVIPKSRGGSNLEHNLVASCKTCNVVAGDRVFRDISAKRRFIIANRPS